MVPGTYSPSWQRKHGGRWGQHEGRSRGLSGHIVATIKKEETGRIVRETAPISPVRDSTSFREAPLSRGPASF